MRTPASLGADCYCVRRPVSTERPYASSIAIGHRPTHGDSHHHVCPSWCCTRAGDIAPVGVAVGVTVDVAVAVAVAVGVAVAVAVAVPVGVAVKVAVAVGVAVKVAVAVAVAVAVGVAVAVAVGVWLASRSASIPIFT